MALSNGILSVGIATILCALNSYFLYKKYREGKMVIFHIIFCIGTYMWIVHNFFTLPLTLSWWREMALKPIVNWSDGIKIIPFQEAYDMINRFGLNKISVGVLLREYVYIAVAPLLIGFSIKDAFIKLKKVYILICSLIFAFFPFIVHSSFVVLGKNLWMQADITYSLLFIIYFWISYGLHVLIKKLW